MFKVYVIYNRLRDKIYIGYTSNLEKRILRHNGVLKNKNTSFTSINSGNWEIVYSESYKTRDLAKKREKQLKGYRGRKFIREKILHTDSSAGRSASGRTN